MRLVVIGPANGDHAALRQRAQFALEKLAPDRVLYLGVDDVFDSMVERWATDIVQGDPSDAAVWDRAARACASSGHAMIDAFLKRERSRARLKMLARLPHAQARTVEMFQGLVTVIIHDKAYLDEEDILPATLLVFGKSKDPVLHRVGQRVFIAPGPIDHAEGGLVLIEEEGEAIVARFHAADESLKRNEVVASLGRSVRLTVQGASS